MRGEGMFGSWVRCVDCDATIMVMVPLGVSMGAALAMCGWSLHGAVSCCPVHTVYTWPELT